VLPVALVAECRAAFDAVDRDGNGRLDGAELGLMLARLGTRIDPAIQDDLMGSLDLDQDGTISFPEFALTLFGAIDPGKLSPALRLLFDVVDRDGSGELEPRELGRALARLGRERSPEEVEKIVQQADLDKSGALELAEFLRLL
jgi:Ca2+-binding EF-hand superfamily protein